MDFSFEFLRIFTYTAYLILPILTSLSVLIIGIGQIVGRIEKWEKLDCLYWTLITATTVGYGDIRPKSHSARMLSVLIAILGVIFTGILVSIAIESTSYTFKIYGDPAVIEAAKIQ
jgi:voltage-gated potassium channel